MGRPVEAVSLSFAEAAEATGGELHGADRGGSFRGLSIDSREVPSGCAFVAVRGERFDAHDFAAQAAEHASLLVLERLPAALDRAALPTTALLVDDTTLALGKLAQAWRDRVAPQVVGVTGSVGKTTTKELLRNILALVGETHATPGNFNNQIGLPLTLLSMPEGTRYLIAEMGMNTPGEIAYLSALARPEVAVVTTVAPVHLERLGSVEAIAAEKASIWGGLVDGGLAVGPADEPLLAPHLAALEREMLLFGERDTGSDLTRARLERMTPKGEEGSELTLNLDGRRVRVALPLIGAHNAEDATCAAAAALALGVDVETIVAGLSCAPQLGHRSTLRRIGTWRVLDDCYNASPRAMRAALDALVQLAAERPSHALLGPMLELGEAEEELHREVGAYAATRPLSALITVGEEAAAIARGARDAGYPADRIHEVATPAEAAACAATLAGDEEAWMLVKGSRVAKMESAIAALEQLGRRVTSST
ncbi:MAG: UDP-N-acetylmuramoyl-tripeptide--D-alanyl-D-alanine ligase [Proteobacteria bacterium]|nr:MAG: UDP-N-acetylmuramoyl-tripeptide--D-alanyl-D-alanine ligase [Pseudomonadota bacterium]PIE17893.1 MAG: UDP-N-acetylmuramoyl-tripeptide--D-alanyl-D-alanine ligase [Pseudomonadota bacterium]